MLQASCANSKSARPNEPKNPNINPKDTPKSSHGVTEGLINKVKQFAREQEDTSLGSSPYEVLVDTLVAIQKDDLSGIKTKYIGEGIYKVAVHPFNSALVYALHSQDTSVAEIFLSPDCAPYITIGKESQDLIITNASKQPNPDFAKRVLRTLKGKLEQDILQRTVEGFINNNRNTEAFSSARLICETIPEKLDGIPVLELGMRNLSINNYKDLITCFKDIDINKKMRGRKAGSNLLYSVTQFGSIEHWDAFVTTFEKQIKFDGKDTNGYKVLSMLMKISD